MNQLHILRYLLFLYGTYFSQDLADFYDSNSVGGLIKRTPKGLAFRDVWGANRFAANTAFLARLAADIGLTLSLIASIHYLLGESSCPSASARCDLGNYLNA